MGAMTRGRLLIGALAVGALLATLAVACGGGDDEEAIQSTIVPGPGVTGTAAGLPAGTPTPASSAVDEQLQAMVLQPSDVPAGFTLASDSFSTNEDVAGRGEDAAEVLAQLTEWGRIRGHGVVFSSEASDEAGVLLVDSTVSIYETDSGAGASFADAVDTARATDWQATIGPDATDVSVEEISPLDVADEMLWLRMTGTAIIGNPAEQQPFIQDVILMRVGRVRGSVSTVAAVADAALLVEDMVRAQVDHMEEGQQ
jgi:hypothetical protein